MPELVVALDYPLPPTLPPGAATAVFCFGRCLRPGAAVAQLMVTVDGRPHPVSALGMPRRDRGGERSGFWAIVPVRAPAQPGSIELGLAARLADGREEVAALGRIEVVEPEPPPPGPEGADGELIAVCMATFEPDAELFAAQIASLRGQSDRNWVCVISDDCSGDEHFARIEREAISDARFVVSRSPRRLGFYRNFERALRMAPAQARLLALCDQDDRWHPEKLAVLRAALGSAQMAYCDQRLVDAQGRVLRETMWQGRRNNHTDLASLLVANSITGAATLFRRDVADLALPFPDTPGMQFHDHWLGLVALAAGDVAYVDHPLYDYVQHAGAVFGDVTQSGGRRPPRAALRGAWRAWRGAYFLGYLGRAAQAQTLLMRCGARLTAGKRAALERFIAAERSALALAWLAARPLRGLFGHNETLASEAELAAGIVWRRVMDVAGKLAPGWSGWDASFPEPLSFQQKRLRRWRALR